MVLNGLCYNTCIIIGYHEGVGGRIENSIIRFMHAITDRLYTK